MGLDEEEMSDRNKKQFQMDEIGQESVRGGKSVL